MFIQQQSHYNSYFLDPTSIFHATNIIERPQTRHNFSDMLPSPLLLPQDDFTTSTLLFSHESVTGWGSSVSQTTTQCPCLQGLAAELSALLLASQQSDQFHHPGKVISILRKSIGTWQRFLQCGSCTMTQNGYGFVLLTIQMDFAIQLLNRIYYNRDNRGDFALALQYLNGTPFTLSDDGIVDKLSTHGTTTGVRSLLMDTIMILLNVIGIAKCRVASFAANFTVEDVGCNSDFMLQSTIPERPEIVSWDGLGNQLQSFVLAIGNIKCDLSL